MLNKSNCLHLLILLAWVSSVAQDTTYVLPHFTVKQGQWETLVSLHNPTSQTRRVEVLVYDENGSQRSSATWQLPAQGGVVGDVRQLIDPLPVESGWLEMHTDTDQIRSLVKFTATGTGGSSSLILERKAATHLVFPLLEETERWFGGMALVNPGDGAAEISLTLKDHQGHVRSRATRTLAPKSKWVAVLRDVFDESLPAQSLVQIESDQAIQGFALSFHEGLTQIVAVPGEAYEPGDGLAKLEQALQSHLETKVQRDPNIPGMILRVSAPELGLDWRGATGLADPSTSREMQSNDRFRIHEVGQLITAALVLRLEEEGLLNLEATVASYLGEDRLRGLHVIDGVDAGNTITVAELLAHRSGLPDLLQYVNNSQSLLVNAMFADPNRLWSAADILAFSKANLRAEFPPGSGFKSSLLNYTLLGLIIEQRTGLSLAEALAEWIYTPTGMGETYLEYYQEPNTGGTLAHPFIFNVDYADFRSFAIDWGGGGLVSSADDLHRFMKTLTTGKLFKKSDTLSRMLTAQSNLADEYGVGLGVFRKTSDCQLEGASLFGIGNGAFLYYSPEKDVLLSGTTNQYLNDGMGTSLELLSILFGRGNCEDPGTWSRYQDAEEAGFDSEQLAMAADTYHGLNASAFLAIHRGKVLLSLGQVARPYAVHSIRKSFLSALYGIRHAQGMIDLDSSLADLNIDDQRPLTELERSATVADLLTARSGVYLFAAAADGQVPPARGAHSPGQFWYYNNWDFNVLGTIYEQASQTSIFDDLETLIAEPLGMQDFSAAMGTYQYEPLLSRHPAYLFRMSARDMARLGQLFIQDGSWKGQQLVPASWVADSTRAQAATGLSRYPGYGYMWWADGGGSYLAQGSGGHKLKVMPNEEMVFVMRVDTDQQIDVSSEAFEQLVNQVLAARQSRSANRR